jgi:hypothetical protein
MNDKCFYTFPVAQDVAHGKKVWQVDLDRCSF